MPSRRDATVTRRSRRRSALVALAGAVVVAATLIATSVPASGHDASIFVDCHEVFVGFSAFPPDAIPVHIAVQVGDVGSKSVDVMVDQHTIEKKVDISDLTASVHGPVTVDVDVTWTFEGPQERQKTAHISCNESGSSSTVENASSTSIAGVSSTSTPVTTGGGGVTSTTSGGGAASSVSSSSTSTSFVNVSGASVSSGSLPFTGGATLPLLLLGLALVGGGAAFILAPRRRSSRP